VALGIIVQVLDKLIKKRALDIELTWSIHYNLNTLLNFSVILPDKAIFLTVFIEEKLEVNVIKQLVESSLKVLLIV